MSIQNSILSIIRKALPPISQTEREALESGTVGWDGELMKGTPDWKKLFDIEKPVFTPEEQAFLNGPVEELCAMLDNWDIQHRNDLPPEVWSFIKKKGFMGLEIPKEYGGLGFSSQAHSAVVIKIASRSLTAAVTVMVPNSLGPGELIHEYGTQQQKDHYLPRLASGEDIPCFALTSPEAGSDAASISDNGVVFKQADGQICIRLNWEKRYITLGPVATLIGLAFKLHDPENLLGKGANPGITVALVPRNTPGVDIGHRHRPMDLAFQNGPNKGHDVILPVSNIIGGPEMAGHGWRMLMECLAVGRCLSLPALSTAGAKLSCYAGGAYSRVRRQFGLAVGKFGGVEEKLAEMAGLTYMMDSARLATLQMVDMGERPAVPSAILKYHLTEKMRDIVKNAMDIYSGKAICAGPKNIFADLYKGIPVAITVEGANIMTRNLIIFGQGCMRAHPHLSKEVDAVGIEDKKEAWKKLSAELWPHIGGAFKNFALSLFYGISRGYGSTVPGNTDPEMGRYYRQINRLCANFRFATELSLLTLTGGLKREERVSARLGDLFGNLYLASTTLWNYEKQGRHTEDSVLVHWACQRALNDAEQALDALLRNHPAKILHMLARPFFFPLGKQTMKPSDRLEKKLADLLREPGAARDRLTLGIFKPKQDQGELGLLEQAFLKSIEAEAIEKKIGQAIKAGTLHATSDKNALAEKAKEANVITGAEYVTLREMDALRRSAIMVDAFPPTDSIAEIAPAPSRLYG